LDSDAQLLRRIEAGDREALAALYARYLPLVWRCVYAQLRGDDPTSRDIVSETFVAALGSLARSRGAIASVGPWLIGIARHKLTDHRRLAAKQAGGELADVPAPDNDPALAIAAADTRCQVTRVMDRLDDLERTVLELKYIDELSVRDIARRLERTEKAVEAMLYRARKSFRELYEKVQSVEQGR